MWQAARVCSLFGLLFPLGRLEVSAAALWNNTSSGLSEHNAIDVEKPVQRVREIAQWLKLPEKAVSGERMLAYRSTIS